MEIVWTSYTLFNISNADFHKGKLRLPKASEARWLSTAEGGLSRRTPKAVLAVGRRRRS